MSKLILEQRRAGDDLPASLLRLFVTPQELRQRPPFRKRHAQDPQAFVQRSLESVCVSSHRDKAVCGYGHINLNQDGIGRCSVELRDPQVLLEPAEEQFHRPPVPVNFRDCPGGQGKTVCQELHQLVTFPAIVLDQPELVGISVFLPTCSQTRFPCRRRRAPLGPDVPPARHIPSSASA